MTLVAVAFALLLASAASSVRADEAVHHSHAQAPPPASSAASGAPTDDRRQLVTYPEALRVHTLANMRDHLATLGQIQEALSKGDFDGASELAEQRLGMSSLEAHGAHEVARYMPKGMQEAGTAMHRSASRLAVAAKDASATSDIKSVLQSLSTLHETCVACHAAYRLQ